MSAELVVVGCSWGGLHAIGVLLDALPAELEAPVVIAQHRRADAPEGGLTGLLRKHTRRTLCEPDDKQELRPRTVYLAPADYHLLVEPGSLALSTEGRVRHSRPSIDILFETAADAYGRGVVAVVLTGANEDGARGAAAVARAGGTVVVEDPATAERAEMPRATLERVPSAVVRRLEDIPDVLRELATGEVAA